MVSGVQKPLISVISSCWIWSKHGWFSAIFHVICSLTIVHWYLVGISRRYFLIFCWSLLDIQLKFGQFSRDFRLLYLWHPVDIQCVQISNKVLVLGNTCVPNLWKVSAQNRPHDKATLRLVLSSARLWDLRWDTGRKSVFFSDLAGW